MQYIKTMSSDELRDVTDGGWETASSIYPRPHLKLVGRVRAASRSGSPAPNLTNHPRPIRTVRRWWGWREGSLADLIEHQEAQSVIHGASPGLFRIMAPWGMLIRAFLLLEVCFPSLRIAESSIAN